MIKDNHKSPSSVLNCGDKDINLSHKIVMAILNVTPDSFYDGGVNVSETAWLQTVERFITDGAGIIDIGAVSTRPGALEVSQEEESERLIPVIKSIVKHFPEAIISVDTYRSGIAHAVIQEGAGMINDISGGTFDPQIFNVVANANLPYILMHTKGTPGIMQKDPQYQNVTSEVISFLNQQTNKALLKQFKSSGYPLLVGISRKSMINAVLGTKPESALNGTTVLNTCALINGADILRVHDVKEAVQAVKILGMMI
jgi:dihydropteroate synthase